MANRFNKISIFILACLLIVGFLWFKYPQAKHLNSPQDTLLEQKTLVNKYLQALSQNSERDLRKLIPSDHDAGLEIREKLKSFGGQPLDNVDIQIVEGEFPDIGIAVMKGKYSDTHAFFEDQLAISRYEKGRWYIILGCVTPEKGGTGNCQHPNFGVY